MTKISVEFVFKEVMGFNTSRAQKVFASSRKQGGASKIIRKNSNTNNIQKRWATF